LLGRQPGELGERPGAIRVEAFDPALRILLLAAHPVRRAGVPEVEMTVYNEIAVTVVAVHRKPSSAVDVSRRWDRVAAAAAATEARPSPSTVANWHSRRPLELLAQCGLVEEIARPRRRPEGSAAGPRQWRRLDRAPWSLTMLLIGRDE